MVLDEGIELDPISQELILKKAGVSSIIDRDEKTILNEERSLSNQERQFLKQTTREPLTLRRQSILAGTFGVGGVQFGAKGITQSKRKARRIVTPRFLKAKREIAKSKKMIEERKSRISLLTLDTPIQDFGIDLSKFKVDTRFIF